MRKIVFNGFDTLMSGLRINSERSETTGVEIRTTDETVPYHDGGYVRPVGAETAKLSYCLILREQNRAALAAKARYIVGLLRGVRGDLLDSDLPGMKYTNAVFKGADPLEYVSRNFTAAYMMIHFEANPIPQETGAISERILKCAASGNVLLTVTNNDSYTITIGGSTSAAVSYTATEPYKYRLVVYAENPETVTLNGTAVTAGEVFVMPSSAVIAITAAGYKYIELWHDTQTGVRL
jgi:hypothetical protein